MAVPKRKTLQVAQAAPPRPPQGRQHCRPRAVRAAARPSCRTGSARPAGTTREEAARGRGRLSVIRIALDAMGGDHAPQAGRGRRRGPGELPPDVVIQLVGRAEVIEAELAPASRGRPPARPRARAGARSHRDGGEAARSGPRASPIQHRRRPRPPEGRRKSDAFVSAGNTGAVAGRLHAHPGPPRRRRARHRRPRRLPTADIPGARPRRRRQRGLLRRGAASASPASGTVYAGTCMERAEPAVGLLNIGEEDEKGNAVVKEAHHLLSRPRASTTSATSRAATSWPATPELGPHRRRGVRRLRRQHGPQVLRVGGAG